MAYDPATIGNAEWRMCEDAWYAYLRAGGRRVVRLHLGEGEAEREGDGAPLIRAGDRLVRAPDLQEDCDEGPVYWEVKYRSLAVNDPWLGRREYWMSYDSYRDYLAVRRERNRPVWVILHAGPPGDASSRWLRVDILTLRDYGRRESRRGRDGEVVDAWVWPVARMTEVEGPALTVSDAVATTESPPPSEHAPAPVPTAATGRPAREQPADRLVDLCRRLGIRVVPQYSVLRVGNADVDLPSLFELARFGIRVFLVSEKPPTTPDVPGLDAFREARLVEWSHATGAGKAAAWVVDGDLGGGRRVREDPKLNAVLKAAENNGGLNASQYHVVHAPAEENVMVRAGAGTGKTATMAERIVYLLATSRRDAVGVAYPYDLRLDDIALVTFTREAAQEMRARISTVLTDRRRLCCECVQPVLAWLSQLPGAQISTIHLLAKRIAQEGAAALGFTSGIRVGKLTIERREALAGALSSPLQRLTNMPMDVPASHEWITHLERIWDTASGNGVEILQSGPATNPRNVLDWGRPTSGRPNLLAQTVEDVLKSAARSFTETCQRLDTVRIDQLVPTAMDVLGTAGIGRVMLPRHLFVDEFQDTDAGQMDLLLALGLRHTIPMFVVGDVKQGVYHFRGAQGSAFRELSERVDDWISEATTAAEGQSRSTRRFAEYSLTYNFRTRAALLDSLAPYFAAWGGTTIGDDEPLLDYDTARDRLMPDPTRRRLPSSPIEFHSLRPREDWASATVDVVQALRRRPGGNDKTIAVLCRDNWQAREIQRALRDREEDCEIHAGGGFFRTEAVREARTFLRAVMDPGDDAALLQLCETRWLTGLFVGTMPFGIRESSISRWNAATRPPKIPWSSRLHALATTRRYDRSDLVDLRIRLTELRSLLHSVDPLAFLAQSRNDFTPQLCSRPSDTGSETARYDRCLDHLIAQLDQTFAGQPITIATMLTWLDLQIATNDHEDEPAPPPPGLRDSSTSVLTHAVTVHKAKGREYDYVVVPYVNGDFAKDRDSRAAVVRRPRGPKLLWEWTWKPNTGPRKTTSNGASDRDWDQELCEVRREETRLLYVAMTRAKEHLTIVKPVTRGNSREPRRWIDILKIGPMP